MQHLFNMFYATIIVAWLRNVLKRIMPDAVPVVCRPGFTGWYWCYVDGCYVAQTGNREKCLHFARCLSEIIGEEHRYEVRDQDNPEPWEEVAIFEPDISDRVSRLIDSLDMDTPDVYEW